MPSGCAGEFQATDAHTRICAVSTYPPTKCGVGMYTSELMGALVNAQNYQVTIIAAQEIDAPKRGSHDGITIIRAWKRDSFTYPLDILRWVLSTRPNLIHLQYEYLLYGRLLLKSSLFVFLLLFLRLFRKPIVVTMHTTIPSGKLTDYLYKRHGIIGRFAQAKAAYITFYTLLIGIFSHIVIVHKEAMRRVLIEDYGFNPKKAYVIPHGITRPHRQLLKSEAKRILRLEDRKVLLLSGFLRRGKGVEHAISAMPKILEHCPNAILMIAGGVHPSLLKECVPYIEDLKRLARPDKEFFKLKRCFM